jgi:N-acetylglucosamine-6-sulfatase
MSPPRPLRVSLLVAAVACLGLLAVLARGESSNAATAGRPNIIMFTTDDQTLRDMIAMPKTQALIGNQGASFLKAFASDPLCCPSRVTVQTGDYAHNTGVLGNTPPAGGYSSFNDKQDLPVWLQSSGYRTIHIGKMPNGFGDDTNKNYVPPGWGPFAGGTGPASRGEFYGFLGPPSTYTGFTLDENGVDKAYGPEDYSTTVYGQLAVDRINSHLTNFPDTPLYMQVQFFAPHDPATPAPQYANAFATAPLPIDPSFNEKDVKDKPGWIRAIRRFGRGLVTKIQTRYRLRLETLLSVDDEIDRIVNDLQARGALGNTYLIFTSDQGLMQGQHRLHQGKFVAYDPSTQVPLLVRGPGIPAGSQPRALVWNGDITSTILQMAGATPGLPQDGRSLLPYAEDPNKPSTRPVLFETGPPGSSFEPGTAAAAKGGKTVRVSKYVKNLDLDHTAQFARAIVAPRYRGIRTGRYLLVKYGDGSREMYDLSTDPFELKSVYKDSRYFPVRKFLQKHLARLVKCSGPSCAAEIGKPPKPLVKPKKHPGTKPAPTTTPAPTTP